MKVIAQKVWNEPAVCIGLLVSLALLILALFENDWTTQTIVGVLAPFASSLGIRQLVRPDAKGKDVGTTYQRPQ